MIEVEIERCSECSVATKRRFESFVFGKSRYQWLCCGRRDCAFLKNNFSPWPTAAGLEAFLFLRQVIHPPTSFPLKDAECPYLAGCYGTRQQFSCIRIRYHSHSPLRQRSRQDFEHRSIPMSSPTWSWIFPRWIRREHRLHEQRSGSFIGGGGGSHGD